MLSSPQPAQNRRFAMKCFGGTPLLVFVIAVGTYADDDKRTQPTAPLQNDTKPIREPIGGFHDYDFDNRR